MYTISDVRQNANSQWTCTVSLLCGLTNSADGSTRQIQFGQAITEVTERILRAQRAILSPSVSAEVFLFRTESDFGHSENSFSSDCIVLQISGPDVTLISISLTYHVGFYTLSCFSLPICIGLFVGGQDSELNLIRDLAISYIKKPSCIILLTVAL
ncbi:hypothetical protein BJV74DRAFT_45795 [Russula compacta]|nr:hypothetical protein BJV74DRAFT_45795 [Russula compacta]